MGPPVNKVAGLIGKKRPVPFSLQAFVVLVAFNFAG